MIAAYVLFLLISIAFFYFTSGIITNIILRVIISAAIFVIFSIILTFMVIRGHTTPPGAKTVDFEEMEKIRRELYKEDR